MRVITKGQVTIPQQMREKFGLTPAVAIDFIEKMPCLFIFELIEDLESAITKAGFQMLEIPKEALFLAGKVYLKYKKMLSCPIIYDSTV